MAQHRAAGRARLAVTAVLAVTALAVTGCGGDDDGDEGANDTTTTEASVGTTSPTFSGQPDSRYCTLSRQVRSALTQPDADELREFYERLDSLADELLGEAPDVIRADVETFLRGIRELQPALEDVDYDIEQLDTSKVSVLNSEEFPTAGNRMMAFDEQVCVPPGATTTAPSADGTAPPPTSGG